MAVLGKIVPRHIYLSATVLTNPMPPVVSGNTLILRITFSGIAPYPTRHGITRQRCGMSESVSPLGVRR